MEYDGSMMFDEYPDKLMMEHLAAELQNDIWIRPVRRPEEMEAMSRGFR